jgi:hypothetical protein
MERVRAPSLILQGNFTGFLTPDAGSGGSDDKASKFVCRPELSASNELVLHERSKKLNLNNTVLKRLARNSKSSTRLS